MGVMEKMRGSTTTILWVLIFSFGVLWILADTQVFDALAVGPQNLGQVNGNEISIEEYNNRVNYYTNQFNQQATVTPEIRALYENQAWEDLVASKLIQQKINELGITVTDGELIDMVTGENPAPFIRQQFQQEDGTIDRIALRAAIEAPENSEIWIMIEQQLRESRRQEKLNNFLSSGLRASSLEVQNEYARENSFADVRYVRFPYGDITDEEISVSEDELREYYNNNPSQYERSESYRFRYVSWDKTPTAADTSATVREIENLRQAFAETEEDSLFLLRNDTATPYNGSWVSRDELREEYAPVLDLEAGEVSEVHMINGDPYVFKKIAEQGDEIRFAVLSYEVIADPVATIDRLAESADEFRFYAGSDGFAEEAERRELRISEASATKENPFIPGLGQSQQTMRALENLSEGDISEPLELANQFIVLQVMEMTPEGVRPFNEVRAQVESRVRTEKRREMMHTRVSELLNSHQNLEGIASEAELEVQTAEGVRMGGASIPGAGREPQVIGAIFGLEAGEMSGTIEGENAVFVVRADDINKADAADMTDEQRQQISDRLEQQKFIAFNQTFIDRLKEDASIRDNRSLLLR